MKKNLLLEEVKLNHIKEKILGNFLLIFLILIFCTPLLFRAKALNEDPVKPPQTQGTIYVSGGAKMVGISSISNAEIIIEKNIPKKVVPAAHKDLNLAKDLAVAKAEKKSKTQFVTKPFKPTQFVESAPSDQNFDITSLLHSNNSILPTTAMAENAIIFHFTALNLPVFIYLLRIYSTDFFKAATLSELLFSRPPPII